MTRREIIKAAVRYSEKCNPCFSDVQRALQLGKEEGFIAGAEQMFKNAWHTEHPTDFTQFGRYGCIVVYEDGAVGIISPSRITVPSNIGARWKKWAQIEDLMLEDK